MKRSIILLLLFPIGITAQILNTDSSSIDFGTVLVGNKDSIQLTVTNRSNDSVYVNNIKFYSYYNEMPFSSSMNSFGLSGNASKSFWVFFEPIQNMWHNSELIIEHNGKSGFTNVNLLGQGRFPRSYYDTTENLAEEDLKKALKWRLAQNYSNLGYSSARDEMYADLDNDGGDVECVYTGTTATFSTRSGANSNSFNCEHTFPQGFFQSVDPERSDIHHLFPTTSSSNSARSNKPFGKVTGATTFNSGGSKSNSSTFEPRNKQKGRTARAMMYFVIRYKDYSNHFSTQENILRTWHNTYPPDSSEEERNKGIFLLQKNRNPFVDYPQLEERISKFVSNSTAPTQFGIDVLQTSINFGKVTIQKADTFNYLMYNRGNQTINFSNFSLTDTNILSFNGNSGMDRSIEAGDVLNVSVIIKTTTSGLKNENLTFDTNIPGSQSSFTIPIRANSLLVSLAEVETALESRIFPNPFQDIVYIDYQGSAAQIQLDLLDISGKIIRSNLIQNGNSLIALNLEELNKGIYIARLTTEDETLNFKLFK